MNWEEAENIRKQALSRIILHPNGKSAVERLQAERGRLRELIMPLNEWFERFAHEYRQRRDDLSAVVQERGDYWPAPLFVEHVQEMTHHFSKAEEHLCGTLFYLERHEMQHPLVQSLLEYLPEHERTYGPLFLYTWMPTSAWAGDLTMSWWDGPSVPEMYGKPRCFQVRGEIGRDRHYTYAGLKTLLHQWCELYGKDPNHFSLIVGDDGHSASLAGYIPRLSSQYKEWTAHNHMMDWAAQQTLPAVKLDNEGGKDEVQPTV